jgi:hypothetical protein
MFLLRAIHAGRAAQLLPNRRVTQRALAARPWGSSPPPGTKTILFKPLITNDLRQQSLLLTGDVANVRLFSGTNLGTVRISFVSKWVTQNVLFCLALASLAFTVNFVSITERAADNRSAENPCSRNSALALGTSI